MYKACTTVVTLLCTVSLHAQQATYPPGTFELTPQVDLHLTPVPVVVPEQFASSVPEGLSLNLPPGFSAKVFAAPGLDGARFMAWDAEGVLHAINMKADTSIEDQPPTASARGHVVALPDRDNDGVADTAIVVADNLKWANSLAFYQGTMYVADTHQILKFRDLDGDGIYEDRAVLVDDIPTGGLHITRTLVIDEINEKIYLAVGSSCGQSCREDTPERAAILQFNIDGTGRRVFARGIRNAVGLTLHPITNQLWATNNGHQERDRGLPPEWIDIVRDDGFYGWPFAYGYQVYIQSGRLRLIGEDSLAVQSMRRPVALVPAHLAPMDIHFYTRDLFPAQYRNAAFIAMRAGAAGWDPGYKVMALFSAEDGSNARIGDFITGFRPDPDSEQVWGKPVGVTSDSRGNLYITSDWVNHLLLKIVPGRLEGTLEGVLPDAVVVGESFAIDARLRLTGLVADGGAATATADLRPLGGDAALPLLAEGDGTFRLQTTLVAARSGRRDIAIRVVQPTSFDQLTSVVSHTVRVYPRGDLPILGDSSSGRWTMQADFGGIEFPPLAAADPTYENHRAAPVLIPVDRFSLGWSFTLQPDAPIDELGYLALTFAFHPGEVAEGDNAQFTVALRPGRTIDLLGEKRVDLQRRDWQRVELTVEDFDLSQAVQKIQFRGNLKGRFYLADMRLVAAAPPPTAVLEERADALPRTFALDQNFPNPFNSITQIRFALPQAAEVDLTVYNLSGQKVAALATGTRSAGTYALRWDGRDARAQPLASGVYIYRLRADKQTLSRKLLLLQ